MCTPKTFGDANAKLLMEILIQKGPPVFNVLANEDGLEQVQCQAERDVKDWQC